MQGAVAAWLERGRRLHLQHGPIDLIVGAEAADARHSAAAFAAARARFDGILEGLMREIESHRAPMTPATPVPRDPVARRMHDAARPFCGRHFLTPMIAVAGAVADSVLAAMRAAAPLRRAYVNNGGDIALHLSGPAEFTIAMAAPDGGDHGRIRIDAASGVGGIATSGAGGRSFSFGIADSVSVLARCAARADVAATLVANAVDLPGHRGIERTPANALLPDSDLGHRRVVTAVPPLAAAECDAALAAGAALAETLLAGGQILGAALVVQGRSSIVGARLRACLTEKETVHV